MFLDLSRFGIVCLRTRLEGDLKNALSQLLVVAALSCCDARAVSDTV